MRKPGNRAEGEVGNANVGLFGTIVHHASSLRPLLAFLRKIAGMPDYQAYLNHLRRCHPERPMPSEGQFYDEFIQARYGDGPTRCC